MRLAIRATGGVRPADPVDAPTAIEHRERPIAAIARAGDQFIAHRRMARIQHRANAEEQRASIVIEQAGNSLGHSSRFSSSPKFRVSPRQQYSFTPVASTPKRGAHETRRICQTPTASQQPGAVA